MQVVLREQAETEVRAVAVREMKLVELAFPAKARMAEPQVPAQEAAEVEQVRLGLMGQMTWMAVMVESE